MRLHILSVVLGFMLACFVAVVGFTGLLFVTGNPEPVVREQVLPSGKKVQVISFHLVWGVEHDQRFPDQDSFALEYISSVPLTDHQAQDREAEEVFEMIRPVSEQWGFKKASMAAFPSAKRQGRYEIFLVKRSGGGTWTFERQEAKVFND